MECDQRIVDDKNICQKCRLFFDRDELLAHRCTGPKFDVTQTRWYSQAELRVIGRMMHDNNWAFFEAERSFLSR